MFIKISHSKIQGHLGLSFIIELLSIEISLFCKICEKIKSTEIALSVTIR